LVSYLLGYLISGAMYKHEPKSISTNPWGRMGLGKPKSVIFNTVVQQKVGS